MTEIITRAIREGRHFRQVRAYLLQQGIVGEGIENLFHYLVYYYNC